MSKAVTVAEIAKRRLRGVHQSTQIGMSGPRGDGQSPRPRISITLSLSQLDPRQPGCVCHALKRSLYPRPPVCTNVPSDYRRIFSRAVLSPDSARTDEPDPLRRGLNDGTATPLPTPFRARSSIFAHPTHPQAPYLRLASLSHGAPFPLPRPTPLRPNSSPHTPLHARSRSSISAHPTHPQADLWQASLPHVRLPLAPNRCAFPTPPCPHHHCLAVLTDPSLDVCAPTSVPLPSNSCRVLLPPIRCPFPTPPPQSFCRVDRPLPCRMCSLRQVSAAVNGRRVRARAGARGRASGSGSRRQCRPRRNDIQGGGANTLGARQGREHASNGLLGSGASRPGARCKCRRRCNYGGRV